MPIIVGNRPIFRIRFQDAEIREVRKGNELKWGLYKITYVNKGPKEIETGWEKGQNIPDYVWGYPAQSKEDFYFYVPDDATAAEAKKILGSNYGYKSHPDYWFDSPDCSELHFIPVVTRNFHRDLTLFCKWRQRRFTFNGTYMYEKTESRSETIQAYAKVNKNTGETIEVWNIDKTRQLWP